VDLVQELKSKCALPGQMIVYCGTKDRTVEMARALGVCYRQSKDERAGRARRRGERGQSAQP
jgi:hypothetical protein